MDSTNWTPAITTGGRPRNRAARPTDATPTDARLAPSRTAAPIRTPAARGYPTAGRGWGPE
ncbi:hypothetical protein, partial [Streptomyces ipomoeae]|uniref:hypothetical protein n=1 Tax=Streptomyces ipomoeae TaxID=103232 RepID=UPI0029A31655